jgi:hypothetical protein
MTSSKLPTTEVEALNQTLTVLRAMEGHMKNISFQLSAIVPKMSRVIPLELRVGFGLGAFWLDDRVPFSMSRPPPGRVRRYAGLKKAKAAVIAAHVSSIGEYRAKA